MGRFDRWVPMRVSRGARRATLWGAAVAAAALAGHPGWGGGPGHDAQAVATTPGHERAASSATGGPGHLTALDGKLEPLIRDFNARRQRPRFLAILSPRCPACVHGAGAIRKVLLDSKPASHDVFIVWTPMVQGDDEAAARRAMAGLEAPHVRHYFDRSNAVGTRFRRDVFPKSVEEMRGSLPADHFFAENLTHRPSDTPEWDLYMFFDPSDSWPPRSAPRPDRWVRQVARFTEPGHGPKSLMWENSYADPPVEGELADRIAALAPKSRGS